MTFLPNTTPLRVEDLQALPEHIAAEAAALAKGRNERNLLTEFELRALIASSGIWLAVHGVTNRKDAPNVIQKWCQLLKHAGLTEAIFHKGERSTPISLETRVSRWLTDYIQRPAEDVPGPKGWRLEVAADAKLDTPMRDLDGKGRIRRARPRPLSRTRTRTRAHAHTHALAPSLARACTPSHPLSHARAHALAPSLAHARARARACAHARSRPLSRTRVHALAPSLASGGCPKGRHLNGGIPRKALWAEELSGRIHPCSRRPHCGVNTPTMAMTSFSLFRAPLALPPLRPPPPPGNPLLAVVAVAPVLRTFCVCSMRAARPRVPPHSWMCRRLAVAPGVGRLQARAPPG